MANDKNKRGRVTPKATPPTAPARRRPRLPNAPIDGPMKAGKRESNPVTLAVIAVAWVGCGIFEIVSLSAWWRYLPGVVMIGIGLLFLRGAAIAYNRSGPTP